MRILQVTNLVSHHQLPIARQLSSTVGSHNFRFAAMAPPDPERLRLGWNGTAADPWILRAGECDADRTQFERWWDDADLVLCGERRFDRMLDRLERGKLCFYMSERWWKPPLGRARLLWPPFLNVVRQFRRVAAHQSFHYLPKGPFAASDIAALANLNGRIWQWGYFTAVPTHEKYGAPPTNRLKVLWAGRMLAWKRMDTLIKAAAALTRTGVTIELTLVGDGPQRQALERLAARLLDRSTYMFSEPVPAAQVPQLMREHHVYVLPSSAYEGWGAVVNEAMACGMAVVASAQSGAAASMIDHGVSGLLFQSGDWRALADHLCNLAGNKRLRETLAQAAQRTACELWSPQVAALRLLELSEALLAGRKPPEYAAGPMARAEHWKKVTQ